jgi:Na+-transporting NADH:ubiquinone oxidoreductase subunit A
MKKLHFGKTFDTELAGTSGREIVTAENPATVALLPARIPHVKPRLLVKQGDIVSIGTPLFEDKRDTSIKFLSTGGGTVENIKYGPRRVIEEIVIRLDEKETTENFEKVTSKKLESMPVPDLVDLLKRYGMWPYLRQLPFRDTAVAAADFPLVIVPLRAGDMYSPLPSVYLEKRMEAFEFGLEVMAKLARKVVVAAPEDELSDLFAIQHQITHITDNRYPAGDPGVILYRIRTSASDNSACYIDGQDLADVGELFLTGEFPIRRVYSVAGNTGKNPAHVSARQGSPVRHLTGQVPEDKSVITGGVFNGYRPSSNAHMGLLESSATVLSEPETEEVLGFIRPGPDKASESGTFLSRFKKSPLFTDTTLHGEERACVNCGLCEKKCPVDLYPHFLMKAVVAKETEEVVAMGLLDCTGCGLCTFVCPSKIELSDTFRSAKLAYYKERG